MPPRRQDGTWAVELLPPLTGTPAQVAWAASLRGHRLHNLDFVTNAVARIMSRMDDVPEDWRQILSARIDAIFAQTAAKWWIDHRYDSTHWLIGWRDEIEAAERVVGAALRGSD